MSGTTTNQRLQQWVAEWAAILQPDDIYWCDGSRRGVRPPVPGARRRRHVHQARRGQAPEQLLGPQRPGRRRPRRGPHVHLLRRTQADAGPNNNWRDPAEMRAEMTALYTGCDEGPHDVRRAVQHGPARLAHRPHRRAAHRLGLRRRQHADHDPHGPGRARRARRRPVGAVPALGRRSARSRARPTRRGRATPTTSTSSTSPRPARSGASARATAATPCSARSASRCASPR